MRKLLSFLGVVTISTSVGSALGLQYANKEQSSVIKKIQNYIDVSSLLARATILSQNPTDNTGIATGGQGFSWNYASQYIDSRRIGDFFPNPASLRGASKDTLSRILLGSMFNYPADNSTPFIPSLTDSNLNLNDPTVGRTGNDPLVNTLGLLSGVLQLVLGSDFNEGLASTINGLLESAALDNVGNSIRDSIGTIGATYLKNQASGNWIFDQLTNIWSEDDLTAAYPNKAFTELNFVDVFQVRQNDFWKGISRILFSGYGADWVSADSQIDQAADPLAKATAAIATQNADYKLEVNGILIEGIGFLIRYLRTLGVFYDSLMSQAMPLGYIKDRNYLFERSTQNGVWLANQIKNNLYAPVSNIVKNDSTTKQSISVWSEEKMPNGQAKYYQLINIQSLVQFFMKLLVVDREKDPHSYETQRVLAILLGVPLDDDNAAVKSSTVDNPFADTILAPLLGAIGDKFAETITVEVPILPPQHPKGVGEFLRQLLGFFRTLLADGKAMWDRYPLTNGAKVTLIITLIDIQAADTPLSFVEYLSLIATQLNKLTTNPLIPANIKEIVKVVYSALMNFIAQIYEEQSSTILPTEKDFLDPFRGLVSGSLLPKIYNLIDSTNLIAIPEAIRKVIPNLNTLLTTPLSEVLGAFGLPLASWPIYLYGLRHQTISELVTTVGDRFDTKRYLNLDENQNYLLNTRAVERLLLPLNDQVTIVFKDGIPADLENLFNGNNTNEVVAILIALAYRNQITSVQVNGAPLETKSFLSYILGIQKDSEITFSYREGSFFYALEQLYGHKNLEEPPALSFATKVTLQKIISNLSALIEWMRTTSIPEYVDDFFTPYFLKGWRTKYLTAANLSRPDQQAFIEYNLIYTLNKSSITYRVRLERNPWDPNGKAPWWNYGAWKLYSINRL